LKDLVSPLLLFLVAQIAVLAGLAGFSGRKRSRVRGMLLLFLAVMTAGLAALSTPRVAGCLERSLEMGLSGDAADVPDYIVVLAGGYLQGPSPDEDVLVVETTRRVLAAVSWWKESRASKLVFSGASTYRTARPAERLPQLMAETAGTHGVPAEDILLESVSTNTREHPLGILALPGITARSSIGIVTSAFHMRRAHREFRRHFSSIQMRPAPPRPVPPGWRGLIPDGYSLQHSALYLQEWAGIAWYALLGGAGH